MALPTSFAPVVIEGNTISAGNYADGSTSTYPASLIQTSADAVIKNNSLSGVADFGYSIQLRTGAACNITENKFLRGNSALSQGYINSSSSSDQVIKYNIFDSPTCDNASENLVQGLTDSSIYESNKNQTKYLSVSLSNAGYSSSYLTSATTANIITSLPNFQIKPTGDMGYINGFFQTSGTTAINPFIWNVNMNNILPQNVRIMGILFSYQMLVDGGNINYGGSSIYGQMFRYNTPINSSLTTPSATYANPSNVALTPIDTINSTSISNTSLYYIYNDYSSYNLYTNSTNELNFFIKMVLAPSATSGASLYRMSPLIIKYRW